MRWNKKYDYPTSSRATEDGIRRYVLGEAKLPSVTSILDATSLRKIKQLWPTGEKGLVTKKLKLLQRQQVAEVLRCTVI